MIRFRYEGNFLDFHVILDQTETQGNAAFPCTILIEADQPTPEAVAREIENSFGNHSGFRQGISFVGEQEFREFMSALAAMLALLGSNGFPAGEHEIDRTKNGDDELIVVRRKVPE